MGAQGPGQDCGEELALGVGARGKQHSVLGAVPRRRVALLFKAAQAAFHRLDDHSFTSSPQTDSSVLPDLPSCKQLQGVGKASRSPPGFSVRSTLPHELRPSLRCHAGLFRSDDLATSAPRCFRCIPACNFLGDTEVLVEM